jgi:hypothetical protein
MEKRKKLILIGFFTLILILAASVGVSQAQDDEQNDPDALPTFTITMTMIPWCQSFTYQGYLADGAAPANGSYDFQAKVWSATSGGVQVGGTSTSTSVSVSNGLFNLYVCLSGDVFTGPNRYLEVSAKLHTAVSYTTLPRQRIYPAPYAYGLYPGAVITDTDSTIRFNVYSAVGGGDYSETGIYAEATSADAYKYGIVGIATGANVNYGVYGKSDDYGVYGETTNDYGVYGYGSGTGTNYGVVGETESTAAGTGVYGKASGATGSPIGVKGYTVSTLGYPVVGLQGSSYTTTDIDPAAYWQPAGLFGGRNGVIAFTEAGNGYALFGWSKATSGGSYGVIGETSKADHNYGLYTADNAHALGYVVTGAIMRVVQNSGSEALEAGDVVAFTGIGEMLADTGVPALQVARADLSSGAAVAGVVYSRYDASILLNGPTQQEGKLPEAEFVAEGPIAPGEYLLIVINGPVQVKASALGGEVKVGDLLTVGGTAGTAAKVGEATVDGAVFGKALEPLAAGDKLIYVYVTLR